MSILNFRRFKYVAFYAGAIAVITAYVYWLANALQFLHWTGQNKTILGRLWSSVTSPSGVVIWTGLIAVFVLTTILAERRRDADRDLKWKRRRVRLSNLAHKGARAERPRKTLSEKAHRDLSVLRQQGAKLHARCLNNATDGIENEIKAWEEETAALLRAAIGDEPADRFLHAPIVPMHFGGFSARVGYYVGQVDIRMKVLSEILKDSSE